MTWLLRIATNTSLNYRRSRRLRRTLSLDAETPTEVEGRFGPADGDIGRTENEARVRAAVAELPANQRAAIVLRHFHDLPYTDIADVLDTSVSAVESLLFRARRTLAGTLAPDTGHDSPQVSAEVRAESPGHGRVSPDAMQEGTTTDLGRLGR